MNGIPLEDLFMSYFSSFMLYIFNTMCYFLFFIYFYISSFVLVFVINHLDLDILPNKLYKPMKKKIINLLIKTNN